MSRTCRREVKCTEGTPSCGSRSGPALQVGQIQRGTQSLSKPLGIVVCPEVHEEKVRRVIDHVAVQCGHLDAMLSQRLQNWIDLTAEQYEVTGDRGLPAPGGLEIDRRRSTHRGWHGH